MDSPATNLVIKTVAYQSSAYQQLVQLRYEILRVPLGLTFPPEFLAKDADDILMGAFREAEAIGCCQLTKQANGVFQLRQMAVATQLQGDGIGTQLIQFAEATAKQSGGNQIMLHAREVAAGFYKKLAYSTIGGRFMEVGIPHFEMVKTL